MITSVQGKIYDHESSINIEFVFNSIHTVNYAYSTYLDIQNCYAMFDIC
jgi:hypothetical protein